MSAKGGKSDNSNMTAKLKLRRYFLEKYHPAGDGRVFDCCQGEGEIWRRLRRDCQVASYWGVDLKPKKGRLKIDSIRVLEQPGWTDNIIDIDTYGSPWAHWLAMLPHVTEPMTVFLTIGIAGPKRVKLSRLELETMGITMPRIFSLSGALTHNLIDTAVQRMLAIPGRYGWRVAEAKEAYRLNDGAMRHWRTRYMGVRLESL